MDNYMKKILRLREDGKIPDCSLGNVNIAHDSWCRKLTQPSGLDWECNCDPDITWYPAKDAEDFAATAIALSARGPKN